MRSAQWVGSCCGTRKMARWCVPAASSASRGLSFTRLDARALISTRLLMACTHSTVHANHTRAAPSEHGTPRVLACRCPLPGGLHNEIFAYRHTLRRRGWAVAGTVPDTCIHLHPAHRIASCCCRLIVLFVSAIGLFAESPQCVLFHEMGLCVALCLVDTVCVMCHDSYMAHGRIAYWSYSCAGSPHARYSSHTAPSRCTATRFTSIRIHSPHHTPHHRRLDVYLALHRRVDRVNDEISQIISAPLAVLPALCRWCCKMTLRCLLATLTPLSLTSLPSPCRCRLDTPSLCATSRPDCGSGAEMKTQMKRERSTSPRHVPMSSAKNAPLSPHPQVVLIGRSFDELARPQSSSPSALFSSPLSLLAFPVPSPLPSYPLDFFSFTTNKAHDEGAYLGLWG